MKFFYLTTAIDYANGSPHLGHAYEKILSDAIVRSRRMEGLQCHFLTGLDEHGQKVQETAERLSIEPQKLCDKVAEEFQAMCQLMQVDYDDYIRTSQPRHTSVVRGILSKLYENGDIYKSSYVGLYSVRAERFVHEKDMVDGKWPEDFGDVIELQEENYFFKMKGHQAWLLDYLKKNDEFIFPAYRQKQVLEFLAEPLNDLCISRPKSRLTWGIELPFDGDYVTYVWFDALINYISAIGYGTERFHDFWPADVEVIGKDILSPAHAVYWPIMLRAIGLELPRQLVVHGWWLAKGGEKMSKSLGNVVRPIDYATVYGSDAFRYFVLSEMSVGQDSDFSHELFASRYRADLSNDIGNLLSRTVNMVERYCGGTIPPVEVEEELERELKFLAKKTIGDVRERCRHYDFSGALESVCALVRSANRYLECRSPWKLAKGKEKDLAEMKTSLAVAAECLRICAALLIPAIPQSAEKMFAQLGAQTVNDWTALDWGNSLAWKRVCKGPVLFPRIGEDDDAMPAVSAR
ncbi:MAG: methionine--tRNA ligase [Puniceicoccales bacterium]|nr:methionine--tRNA ligase [Puniceicoccales bacterium]